MRNRAALFAFWVLLAGACAPTAGRERDWSAQPAFLVEETVAPRTWIVSDVHGGLDRLLTLLQAQGLVDDQRAWIGGADRLYVLGDMIDKAPGGLDTMRFLRSLQGPARARGGAVVVTMGNHEAEFLADPFGDKSALFLGDLATAQLDPRAVADGADIGAWMRGLPFGVLDGDWFFSHAGQTAGRSIARLEASFRADVSAHGFAAGSLTSSNSLLEATLWWQTADPVAAVDAVLSPLPARHLVVGHDPSALGKRGSIGQILGGRLFLVDTGMSPGVNDSQGALMLLERSPGGTVVSAAFPTGPPGPFYQE